MEGSDWQGGRKDGRLYRNVRAEMERVIREKYERLKGCLDERARRLWASSEAIRLDRAGFVPGESRQRQGGSDGRVGDGKRKPSKNRVW